MGVALLERCVADCVRPVVPDTHDEQQAFLNLLQAAVDFEQHLKQAPLSFIPTNTAPFKEFAQQIDTVFADRRCQKLLTQARELIQRPLHDLVLVSFLSVMSKMFWHEIRAPRPVA